MKVFIGMPAYNGERFIKEAIDSIINQSYTNWEMFISDDSSNDNTQSISKEYAKKDPRITYYKQEKNLGMFPNFKFVLDKADTPYFMWAAQDDMWEKDFIKVCVRHFERDGDLGLATTCMVEMDSFSRVVRELPWLNHFSGKPRFSVIVRYVLEPEILGKCNLMYGLFRTNVLKKIWKIYPQRSVWGQDYMFALAAISHFNTKIDKRMLFKKRYGGFSNPTSNEEDTKDEARQKEYGHVKNHMFPFGRFWQYFRGHMEAVHGTPYRSLVALLLIIRLPRSFLIYLNERSLIKNIKKTLKNPREAVKMSAPGKMYVTFRERMRAMLYRIFISRKEKLILKYQKKNKITVFVETGTYRGDMIKAMLEHFDSIYSIELGMELFQKAVVRFHDEKKVHLFQGDSAEIIHKIEKILSVPRIYWLDAHYSNGVTARADIDTPINDELNAVLRNDICSIILIDDARLFDGTNGYPMINELSNNITENYPSLNFKVSRDVIQIFPKNRTQIASVIKSR